MKREFFKGVVVALALTVMTTTAIYAQEATPKEKREPLTTEQRAEKMTEQMAERLKLTESQKSKLRRVNLDYIKKVEASRMLKANHNLAVLDILDANQSSSYINMIANQKRVKQGAKRKSAAKMQNRSKCYMQQRGCNPNMRVPQQRRMECNMPRNQK